MVARGLKRGLRRKSIGELQSYIRSARKSSNRRLAEHILTEKLRQQKLVPQKTKKVFFDKDTGTFKRTTWGFGVGLQESKDKFGRTVFTQAPIKKGRTRVFQSNGVTAKVTRDRRGGYKVEQNGAIYRVTGQGFQRTGFTQEGQSQRNARLAIQRKIRLGEERVTVGDVARATNLNLRLSQSLVEDINRLRSQRETDKAKSRAFLGSGTTRDKQAQAKKLASRLGKDVTERARSRPKQKQSKVGSRNVQRFIGLLETWEQARLARDSRLQKRLQADLVRAKTNNQIRVNVINELAKSIPSKGVRLTASTTAKIANYVVGFGERATGAFINGAIGTLISKAESTAITGISIPISIRQKGLREFRRTLNEAVKQNKIKAKEAVMAVIEASLDPDTFLVVALGMPFTKLPKSAKKNLNAVETKVTAKYSSALRRFSASSIKALDGVAKYYKSLGKRGSLGGKRGTRGRKPISKAELRKKSFEAQRNPNLRVKEGEVIAKTGRARKGREIVRTQSPRKGEGTITFEKTQVTGKGAGRLKLIDRKTVTYLKGKIKDVSKTKEFQVGKGKNVPKSRKARFQAPKFKVDTITTFKGSGSQGVLQQVQTTQGNFFVQIAKGKRALKKFSDLTNSQKRAVKSQAPTLQVSGKLSAPKVENVRKADVKAGTSQGRGSVVEKLKARLRKQMQERIKAKVEKKQTALVVTTPQAQFVGQVKTTSKVKVVPRPPARGKARPPEVELVVENVRVFKPTAKLTSQYKGANISLKRSFTVRKFGSVIEMKKVGNTFVARGTPQAIRLMIASLKKLDFRVLSKITLGLTALRALSTKTAVGSQIKAKSATKTRAKVTNKVTKARSKVTNKVTKARSKVTKRVTKRAKPTRTPVRAKTKTKAVKRVKVAPKTKATVKKKPRNVKKPPFNPRLPPLPKIEGKKPPKSVKNPKGYEAWVFDGKSKQWKRVNKISLSKANASRLGRYVSNESLGASWLAVGVNRKASKRKVTLNASRSFFRATKDKKKPKRTRVEKRKYRLNTKGEKRKISVARKIAQVRRKLKPKKRKSSDFSSK